MKNSKTIADYLGYKYIPFNDLQGFPKAGVWEEATIKNIYSPKMGWEFKTQSIGELSKIPIKDKFIRFKARTYKELTLSIEDLLKVVENLENEDLRVFGLKWEEGDEICFNNLGLDFYSFNRAIGFDMNFELDPSKNISRKEFKNYGEDFRDKLEELVVETIEYLNRIKNERN